MNKCIILENFNDVLISKADMRIFNIDEDEYQVVLISDDYFTDVDEDGLFTIPSQGEICDIEFNEFGIPVTINDSNGKQIYKDNNTYYEEEYTVEGIAIEHITNELHIAIISVDECVFKVFINNDKLECIDEIDIDDEISIVHIENDEGEDDIYSLSYYGLDGKELTFNNVVMEYVSY